MGGKQRTIVAIIAINYTDHDISTYESVTIQRSFVRDTLVWNSGDVLNDFASALNHARQMYQDYEIDEIILHESCSDFVEDSDDLYTFNLDHNLVEKFVYD